MLIYDFLVPVFGLWYKKWLTSHLEMKLLCNKSIQKYWRQVFLRPVFGLIGWVHLGTWPLFVLQQ